MENGKKKSNALNVALGCLACFLIGVITGFLVAPAKNGLNIGCNNRINDKPNEDFDSDYAEDEE